MKKDNVKIFIDEVYSRSPDRNYPMNNITYNPIEENWIIDLMNLSDYKVSKNSGFRYIFVIIDNFSKYT